MNILRRVSGHFNDRDYYHNALISLDAVSLCESGSQIVLAPHIVLAPAESQSWATLNFNATVKLG
jgi:hypothetical protein